MLEFAKLILLGSVKNRVPQNLVNSGILKMCILWSPYLLSVFTEKSKTQMDATTL